jgi:steroid delta-isomerase-like uncharacterized protein
MKRLAILLSLSLLAALPAHADLKANTEIAKRVFLEKMGQGRFDKLEEIYAPGFVAHGVAQDYTLEEDNESGKQWRAAFPDLQVTVVRTVAQGDMVAVHFKATGTNSGKDAGMPGAGKKANMDGMTFFRFKAGRIAEEWSVLDIASLNRQMNAP